MRARASLRREPVSGTTCFIESIDSLLERSRAQRGEAVGFAYAYYALLYESDLGRLSQCSWETQFSIGCLGHLKIDFQKRVEMSMTAKSRKKILVTGGNSGIGFALCRQLVLEHGCHVFLGSRSRQRGEEAVASIRALIPAQHSGSVELTEVDVGEDASVLSAANAVREALGTDGQLYGLVNNAGIGLAASVAAEEVLNTNLYGVKRMCDAFVTEGLVSDRVVNVGSGSGPGYVHRCPQPTQRALCKTPADWKAIEAMIAISADGMTGLHSEADVNGAYGLSKAMLALYTMLFAEEMPNILSSCVSPGWIATKLVAGSGATKKPEEGTLSIRHCLFESLSGSGWYYGSDCVRSPLHFMRNPGEPAYDGVVDDVIGL